MAVLQRVSIPADYWNAICTNDAAFDDEFFYGVESTGIFCRPSCRSRMPKKENVRIFKNAYAALGAGYRPCKRCKPEGLNLPAAEWVEQITEWLDHHYTEPATLQRLAEISHGSPYHLQRLFKRFKNVSPSEYVQKLRLEKAEELLKSDTLSVAEAGHQAGFGNTPYFITLFRKTRGMTPGQFRTAQKLAEGAECHGNRQN
ncbi:bifunctional transcriptional activator/DNA repair enzyme AdaA [Planococcus sp. FY231025]|uniref:bifunctional transcriptional activator/DNA repair enzyme AdaA n=1 Tax=Planococcus sp. FY231025 TaxID=3455699 RepID=UPI003F91B1F2